MEKTLKLTCTELDIDSAIYGNPAGAYSDSKDTANRFWTELLENLANNLNKVYELMDLLDEENLSDSTKELVNNIDTYQIGDVINFLQSIALNITEVEK